MIAITTLLLGFLALVGAQSDEASTETESSESGTVTGSPVPVILNGTNEVPPTASAATGVASLYVNDTQLCYNMTLTGLTDVTASHIHKGSESEAGPIVITLFSNANKTAAELSGSMQNGCVNSNKTVLSTIGKNATGYYVNVHTTMFPAGEIRGQISKLFVNETTGEAEDGTSSDPTAESAEDTSSGTTVRRQQAFTSVDAKKASSTLKRLFGQ